MNEFARLLGRQLGSELRALPRAARRRASASGRAARCATIGDLRTAARRALPGVIFDFIDGGAGDEVTLRRNRAELDAVRLRPRVLTDVAAVETATTILGRPVALPLMGAPMGLQGLIHPDGEVAVARGMHAAGSIAIVSSMASYGVEEVAALAPGPLWFQLYVFRDRGFVRELIERARAAGYEALVLTVDVQVSAARERDRRNGFGIPPRATARSLAGGVRHPRWTARALRRPRMSPVNALGRGDGLDGPVSAVTYINDQYDPGLTWDDLEWFRDAWGGPLVLKGVLDPEDARRAAALGAAGILVSNHGGRQLDHAPSSISALPAVAEAVGDDAEVYLDSGVRRGSDIVKALAAGARACVVGRPLAYGLGVAGAAGTARAAAILHEELRTALALAGCRSVHELDGTWIDQPTVR